MTSTTADEVLAAIDAVHTHFPELSIIVTTDPLQHTYVIKPERFEIIVDGTVPAPSWARALLDALNALCAHHGAPPVTGTEGP